MSRFGAGKGGIPPELAGQVSSFLRTTFRSLDAVKDAAVAASRAGKLQLDVTLLNRRRRAALAVLGESVLALVEQGAIDEADVPELAGPIAEIRALDIQIQAQAHQANEATEAMSAAAMAGDPRAARPPGEDPGWRARWNASGGDPAAPPAHDLESLDGAAPGASDGDAEADDLESFAEEADDLPADWNRRRP